MKLYTLVLSKDCLLFSIFIILFVLIFSTRSQLDSQPAQNDGHSAEYRRSFVLLFPFPCGYRKQWDCRFGRGKLLLLYNSDFLKLSYFFHQPPDRSRIPLALDDASASESQLREIRTTYRLHTTTQWIRSNIDDEFRDQIGSFYASLVEANLPPPRLFSPGGKSFVDKAKITEWNDGQKDDALSVWDVRELPAESVRGDSGPPSNAENDFYEHSLLIDILPRHKRGIYVDVPRTFSEFEQKSDVIAKYLAVASNKERMLRALCRMLCVACKLHRMGYCQGMNYIAASVLLNCVCETDPDETGDALEIKACQLFCHLLTCQNIIDWFRESQILSKELEKLNFILMRHVPSSLAAQYLDKSGFSTQVWAMEWFTTCCTVGAPRELGLLVQNMLLDGKETDVIFKVGAAMTSLCQDKIVELKGIVLT